MQAVEKARFAGKLAGPVAVLSAVSKRCRGVVDGYGVKHGKAEITLPGNVRKWSFDPGLKFIRGQCAADGQLNGQQRPECIENRCNLGQVAQTMR